MQITTRTWNNYIARLSRLNEAAGQKMREYIRLHGTDDTEALISYAYAVTTGTARAARSLPARCMMHWPRPRGCCCPQQSLPPLPAMAR